MPQVTEMSELFLTRFIRAIIDNSLSEEEKKKLKIIQKITEKQPAPLIQATPQPTRKIPTTPQAPYIPSKRIIPVPQFLTPPRMRPRTKGKKISIEELNLGKISKLLKDPSVLSIESPGPGKNILVNRAGTIQTTSITLTKNEIDNIMTEISDKTRIPLISGLFKVVLDELLLTAIISDFVGTRFLIQKRTPFVNKAPNRPQM